MVSGLSAGESVAFARTTSFSVVRLNTCACFCRLPSETAMCASMASRSQRRHMLCVLATLSFVCCRRRRLWKPFQRYARLVCVSKFLCMVFAKLYRQCSSKLHALHMSFAGQILILISFAYVLPHQSTLQPSPHFVGGQGTAGSHRPILAGSQAKQDSRLVAGVTHSPGSAPAPRQSRWTWCTRTRTCSW